MLIIGAKGHAKEILDILLKNGENKNIKFFDDINEYESNKLYGKYVIINSYESCKKLFKEDNRFILGIGNPKSRFELARKFKNIGGILESVIANDSILGSVNCKLGKGLNIMHKVLISNDTIVGEGTLLNAGCNIHHDVEIGRYCEISPQVVVTGGCKIGDFSRIGSGAIILPGMIIGSKVLVCAGSTVNRNIEDNAVVAGFPARVIRHNKPFDF